MEHTQSSLRSRWSIFTVCRLHDLTKMNIHIPAAHIDRVYCSATQEHEIQQKSSETMRGVKVTNNETLALSSDVPFVIREHLHDSCKLVSAFITATVAETVKPHFLARLTALFLMSHSL